MKRTSIQSPYFAAYYHRLMKRKNGFKKGMIRDRGEVLRLLSIIWKTVSEHYVEADAGVYVDNVGYLCHVLIPGQRFTVRRDLDIVSRLGTNGYLYNHLAMDFADSKRYYHFVIQDSLKKKLRVKMNKGRRYRFMYNEILAKIKNWDIEGRRKKIAITLCRYRIITIFAYPSTFASGRI